MKITVWFLSLIASLHLASVQAVAQTDGDGSWIEPAEGFFADLTQGLINIGAPVIGLGVVIFALWAGATGRIDFTRLGMLIVAALLLAVGPVAVTGLLGQ